MNASSPTLILPDYNPMMWSRAPKLPKLESFHFGNFQELTGSFQAPFWRVWKFPQGERKFPYLPEYIVVVFIPSLGVNQTGSTNFSRVRTAYCDFHPDPCSGMAKNHVCRPCAELLCRSLPLFQADLRRTHLRPSCDLNENLWSRFCARGASVTRWRARAEVRGGGPCS